MGLDMWFREDQERILASLAQAASRYAGEFQEGYMAALRDMAVAHGLAKPNTEQGCPRRPVLVEHKGNDWR